MSVADHNKLDALLRLAKDRAATPAEKATAQRLAKALAAKASVLVGAGARPMVRPCPSHRRRGGDASGSSGLRRRPIRSRWPGSGCMRSGSSASLAWSRVRLRRG
jgi:hypothetical protein